MATVDQKKYPRVARLLSNFAQKNLIEQIKKNVPDAEKIDFDGVDDIPEKILGDFEEHLTKLQKNPRMGRQPHQTYNPHDL